MLFRIGGQCLKFSNYCPEQFKWTQGKTDPHVEALKMFSLSSLEILLASQKTRKQNRKHLESEATFHIETGCSPIFSAPK